MFLGAMPRRPEKAEAYKELRKNLIRLGLWVAFIRSIPYAIHFLSPNKDRIELTL
jgi:hypothetical protein